MQIRNKDISHYRVTTVSVFKLCRLFNNFCFFDDDGVVELAWGASSGIVVSYHLEVNDGTDWIEIYSGIGVTYTDTGLVDGAYSYRVKACNTGGCSAYTAELSVSVTVLVAPMAVQYFQYDDLGR